MTRLLSLILAAGLGLAMLTLPTGAQTTRSAVAVASSYAMQHARETGTTVYGVQATTIDFSRDGYPEMFGLYTLNNDFAIPIGSFMIYFRGTPNGWDPVTRVELAGVSPSVQSHQLSQIFIASQTAQGQVVQGFLWTPGGLQPIR